jgi:hypothetical protein
MTDPTGRSPIRGSGVAEFRRDPGIEGRAARSELIHAALYAMLAAAVWVGTKKYWPAQWVQPDKRTFHHIVLGVTVFFIVVACWRLLDGVVHLFRWGQARRWERMLGDPSTAELVPPLAVHFESTPSTPPGPVLIGWCLLLGAASVGFLAYGVLALAGRVPAYRDESGNNQSGYFIFVGLFLVLLTLVAIRDVRRWRVARTVERLSSDAASTPTAESVEEAAVRRASEIGPLSVVFGEDLTGPIAQAIAGRVPGSSGDPLRILYLRLFDNVGGTEHFLNGPCRLAGNIYFLRSATQVDPKELESAQQSGSVASMFIGTTEELDAAIRRLATGRYDEPRPEGFVKTYRWMTNKERGRYPVVALLCRDGFWKSAIDHLMPRMDFVALDLTGYRPEHTGTRYELQRVIDRYPIDRVAFLAETSSDRLFLTGQVEAAWARMADESPNAGSALRTAHVAVLTGS